MNLRTGLRCVLPACLAMLLSCSKDAPPQPSPREDAAPPSAAAQTGAVARSAPEKAAESNAPPQVHPEPAAMTDEEFEKRLADVRALEEDTEFTAALGELRLLLDACEPDPDRRSRVTELIREVTRERRDANLLRGRIRQLGNPNPNARELAAEQFLEAGRAARLLLRKAAADAQGRTLDGTLDVLVEMGDTETIPVILQRLPDTDDPATFSVLDRGLTGLLRVRVPEKRKETQRIALGRLADHVARRPAGPCADAARRSAERHMAQVSREESEPLKEAFAAMADSLSRCEEAEPRLRLSRLLLAAMRDWHGGSAESLAAWLGRPAAAEHLRAVLESAMAGSDNDLTAWAVSYADAFGLYLPGVLGTYYRGTNFDEREFERLDQKIDFPTGDFGYAGVTENVSVRWTAKLRVTRKGSYTFHSTSDDGQRLYINGKLIIDDWTMHGMTEVSSAPIDLEAGLHDFKSEFFQGSGEAGIRVSWSGPELEKQLITGANLLSRPPPK